MKIALIFLPRYLHTKRLILQQLATLEHTFFVFEQGLDAREFGALPTQSNVILIGLERVDLAMLSEQIAQLQIDQVISFSDRGLMTAAYLRERFGMPGNSVQTETWVVNKGLMRERLNQAGLSRIQYKVTTIDQLVDGDAGQPLPVIVKPTSMTGSLCVELIESTAALRTYVDRCEANKVFQDGNVIVEEYMPGKEFSVEGVVLNGHVHILGITESHTSGVPFFVGTGHDFFAEHPDAARIEQFIVQVVQCLEFKHCPFHIEVKHVDNGFEIVEVHSRFGGAMIMELVEHATGCRPFSDYIGMLVNAQGLRLEKKPGLIYSQHLLAIGEGRVGHIKLEVDLSKDARVISYALDYQEGDVIERDVLPVNYAGYVTFKADSLETANAFRAYVDRHLVVELD